MKKMATNSEQTAYCLPYDTINQKVGYYFKTYSQLDLREILLLKSLESQGEHQYSISNSVLSSEVLGISAFETLWTQTPMINSTM